jgi:hypothetical protein
LKKTAIVLNYTARILLIVVHLLTTILRLMKMIFYVVRGKIPTQ